MAEKPQTFMRVKEAFAYMVGNVPDVLRPGDIVAFDHPAIKGREDKFELVTTDNTLFRDPTAALVPATGVIESATAAPGQKRSVGRPRPKARKTAAKKATPAKG